MKKSANWERHRANEDEAKTELKEKFRSRLMDMVFAKCSEETVAGVFGGGETGRNMAALITWIRWDLPLEDPQLAGAPPPRRGRATESTNGNHPPEPVHWYAH